MSETRGRRSKGLMNKYHFTLKVACSELDLLRSEVDVICETTGMRISEVLRQILSYSANTDVPDKLYGEMVQAIRGEKGQEKESIKTLAKKKMKEAKLKAK